MVKSCKQPVWVQWPIPAISAQREKTANTNLAWTAYARPCPLKTRENEQEISGIKLYEKGNELKMHTHVHKWNTT